MNLEHSTIKNNNQCYYTPDSAQRSSNIVTLMKNKQ